MRRQGTIDETGRGEEPPLAVRLQDEGIGSTQRVETDAVRLWLVIRSLAGGEVGDVSAGPHAGFIRCRIDLVRVPVDPLLLLGPGGAVRPGRGAVVDDAPVGRPSEAPAQIGRAATFGIRHTGGCLEVLHPRFREDAGVDPGGAGSGAVILERGKTGKV